MASSLERFRRAKFFLLFVTFYSVTVQLVNYSVFHPILPFYLRELYNSQNNYSVCNGLDFCGDSDDSDVEMRVSQTIGLITGTGSAMQLVTSLFSGFLLQRFSLHMNLIFSVVLNLMAPALAFFAQGVATMCLANAAISAGALLTFITYYSILSERSSDDRERMRLVSLYNIFNGLGNVIGYSAASASYQFLGHRITFAILFGLIAVDLVLRCLIKSPEEAERTPAEEAIDSSLEKGQVEEITRSQLLQEIGPPPELEDEEEALTIRDWFKYISDPYVVLVNVQTFFLFISICTLCTTGPNFVSGHLRAEQWQTGLNMGVGSTVELIMLSVSAIFVNSHERRWGTILSCCLLNAVGFFWYPFASSVWEVMVPEMFIRVSKAVGIVFVGTLYPYITDCRSVGDCKMGYAIHGLFFSIGATLGSFGAGLIVVSATFQWLYISVGVSMLVAAFTVLPFIKLHPKETLELDVRSSRISIASWPRKKISTTASLNMIYSASVNNLQMAHRTNLSQYNVSQHSATSRNNLRNSFANSMADMTMSRLSIGRAFAL